MLPPAPEPPIEHPPAPAIPPKNIRGRELGLLVAVVDRARNLPDPHRFSKQDPFVEVELTGSLDPKTRTRVDERGGQVPVWDEEFRFRLYEVDGSARQYLVLSVQRQERKDDVELIGEARIMVDGSWDRFDQWVDLKRNGKYQGEIYVELTFYRPEQPAQRPSIEQSGLSSENPTQPGDHGFPTLRQRLSTTSLQDTATPPLTQILQAGQGGPRRSSFGHPAPLPLPGEPDLRELPAALRPGRPPAQQGTPRPEHLRHSSSQSVEDAPARLHSPGGGSAVATYDLRAGPATSGPPVSHLGYGAAAEPGQFPFTVPAIAVSHPQTLQPMGYPSSSVPYMPAFGAPILSTTPVPPPPADHAAVHAHHISYPDQHRPVSAATPAHIVVNQPPAASAAPAAQAPFPTPESRSSPSPSPGTIRPPIPPRPSSSSSMSRMPGALPSTPPTVSSPSPAVSPGPSLPSLSLSSNRHSSLSPPPDTQLPHHRPTSSSSRPLSPNPIGDVRPSPTPSLDSKHREAAAAAAEAEEAYQPPPPSYASNASGSTVTPYGAVAAAADAERRRRAEEQQEAERRARIAEEQQARMQEERRKADEARRRMEEEALLAQRREEEDTRRRLEKAEGERRRMKEERRRVELAEAEERAARIERERLAQVQALSRKRAARLLQEEEDARIAAQLVAEAEQAERLREEERRAADEEAIRRMLEEEQAEATRAQQERERQDEEFARQFREEEHRREAEERRAREAADEALALRLREEEDGERRRRMLEDERIARSLAERDGTPRGRRRAPPA